MEKNLPFVSVAIVDNAYNNRVLPFLGKIDNGNLFKWFVVTFWRLLSYGVLLGGIVITVIKLFGDSGYFKIGFASGMTGAEKAGSAVGLLIGFVASICLAWGLYSLIKKRTDELEALEYEGLLDYLFGKVSPRSITLVGEMLFGIIFYIGFMQLIAALVGSSVYAPLAMGGMGEMTGINEIGQNIPNAVSPGNYDMFMDVLLMGLTGIVMSFIILIAFYIYREVYNFALKIVIALLAFIPKFAIPLAIRTRSEN